MTPDPTEHNQPEPVELPWKRLCDETPKIGEEVLLFMKDHTQRVAMLDEEYNSWEEPYYHATYFIDHAKYEELEWDNILYWRPTEQPVISRVKP